MRALVAPDKFKGTIAAGEVAAAVAAGLEQAGAEADLCPIADGGEGTASILLAAGGGTWHEAEAADPLGRPVECRFALLGDGATAVVEVAEASGLWRLGEDELAPIAADTRGTGELVAAAVEAGATRLLLACGGSATTDGAAGATTAFDPTTIEITCLCDTRVTFLEAAGVFAAQKGAGEAEVAALEARLVALAAELPHDPTRLPFTGAAGGLAGGFWARGARLVSGADHVLGAIDFDRRLAGADLVVTGEGRLDRTSLRGKGVGEVLGRALRTGVPCHAIVGERSLTAEEESAAGFASVRSAGTAAELSEAGRRLA